MSERVGAAASGPERSGGKTSPMAPHERASRDTQFVRVVVADVQPAVRAGLVLILDAADGIEVVGEAADGRQAIAVAREARPDVVCLDVRMPVMDGVAAAKPLSEHAKVLMLSYSEDEPLVTGAISNGASGYLVHGRFEPEELEQRIKAIARGEMVLSPAVTPAVFDALRRAPGPANDEREEGLGSLTAREREVLNLLARGMSNRDIAEELVITNKTVKNHLSRIYEKIGVHSRAEAIALWLGVGGR
jgi:DNA-binding NarL/FixJ family response regulator